VKYDASRDTYARDKHYRRVLIQQGRVQIDADWNEQSDIIAHRAETEALDVIGPCGGPLHDAAFEIAPGTAPTRGPASEAGNAAALTTDFTISGGRYYVDGILCENEGETTYSTQPDLPHPEIISATGLYVVYIDVWQRHLTALDDPSIRETALGGPDTATRSKTVWQVKWVNVGTVDTEGSCGTNFRPYDAITAAPTGTLTAQTSKEQDSTNPCTVPPGGGFRGLENQLYRVEVHFGGTAPDAAGRDKPVEASLVPRTNNQIRVRGGKWETGQNIELVSIRARGTTTMAQITAIDAKTKALTLNRNISRLVFDAIRPVGPTYKWSRDNGVVVTAIQNISGPEVTVHDLGPDAVLGFVEGQWVEVLDDQRELNGIPGDLAQIVKIERAINLITLSAAPSPLVVQNGVPDLSGHPKLRRWDGIGAITTSTDATAYIDLEDGVQIRFGVGRWQNAPTFRTGDYWTIPARTATADTQAGNIEWPHDDSGNGLAQLPFGIEHHYCRLAMLRWEGGPRIRVDDCRNLFPPVTELTNLFYVSGDGQESLPGAPIPQLLQVSVFNGQWPVESAHVRFVTQEAGRLAKSLGAALTASTTPTVDVFTGADGIASCAWKLDPDVSKPSQQVEARLLDSNNQPLPPVIRFNGNLSLASQVAYDPSKCPDLKAAGVTNVQDAIDALCKESEPGIRITDVVTSGENEPLLNDTLVPVSKLIRGITIVCEGLVNPVSFGLSPDPPTQFPNAVAAKPTCFVTLDLPYPLGTDRNFWDFAEIVGFQPLIVDGSVDSKENQIHWSPSGTANKWLQELLFLRLRENKITDRVLAHLTLKGNYIWLERGGGPPIYLDAEGFGRESKNGRVDVILPTGDGRKGGDFEMWFWLIPDKTSKAVLNARAEGLSIVGSVEDGGKPVPPGLEVTLALPNGPEQKTTTDDAGGFRFIRLAAATTYRVSVEVGGVALHADVTTAGKP
jgi:hypothetical protein